MSRIAEINVSLVDNVTVCAPRTELTWMVRVIVTGMLRVGMTRVMRAGVIRAMKGRKE